MALFLIPCAPGGVAAWSQTTTLDGRDYRLAFDWSQRAGHWSLSIADVDGVAIASGLTLVSAYPLLRGAVGPARPPGELVVMDTQAPGAPTLDPGFSDLGARFVLVYADAAELGR